MTSDLPIVACSWLLTVALRGAETGVGSGDRLTAGGAGRCGSADGLGLGEGGLVGFHITANPFVEEIEYHSPHLAGQTRRATAACRPPAFVIQPPCLAGSRVSLVA